jgi:hypothetical protein
LCTPFEDFPSPTAVPPHDGFAALLPFTPSRLTPRRPGTGFTDMATSTTAYAEVFVTGRSDALTADARHFRSPAEADASCGMHRRDIVGPPGGDRCEVSSGPPRLSTPGTGSPPHGIPSMPGHTSTGPGFPFRREMARVDMVLRKTAPMRQAHRLELATAPRPRRAALPLVVPAMRPQDFPSGRSLDRLGCSLGSVVLRLPSLSRERANRRLLLDPNRSSNR